MKAELYREIFKALNEDLNMILSDDDFEEPEINLGVHISNIQKNVLSDSILNKCKEQDVNGLKELIHNCWDRKNPIFFASDDNIKMVIEFSVKALGNKANLNWIDTSNVTDMSSLFKGEGYYIENKFNGNISKWDVSNVKSMHSMFKNSRFNGSISTWNVSSVTNMYGMFDASKFNGDISKWNVSNVTDMRGMFLNNRIFEGDISKWDVSNVEDMGFMFCNSNFNGDISQWNVSRVTDMYRMFARSQFNGDISQWNVSNVTNMGGMFCDSDFNGDISKWNVSSVTEMTEMFKRCALARKRKYQPKFDYDSMVKMSQSVQRGQNNREPLIIFNPI